MNSVDKEKAQLVRDFFKNHPEAAKDIVKENPKILEWLATSAPTHVEESSQANSRNSNSMGNKQLVKNMSGAKIPRMFDWDDNGFSNYLMLAILAFSIQLIITLICIFFYK